jgi:leucyl aminopeptidase (aminopeptidase T)
MKHIEMMRGAKKLMDTCTKVQEGETVLIVADTNKTKIAEVIASAAYERNAEVIITVMAPRKVHGEEPPKAIAEAMKKVNVFFIPVSKSITHTRAVKEAAEAGARGLVLTDWNEDIMISGGIEAEFDKQRPVCKKLAQLFRDGKKAHLTTPLGTDLLLDLEGRRGNALTCIVEPGEFSTVPTIEANFSPNEGTAEGTIVADASIPYLGIGVLTEPVKVKVHKGMITEITGGIQAKMLKDNLEKQNDPMVYNIAELGVGLNPQARMCGIMLEDEGVFGVVHIGIGPNITLGGKIKAAVHYDLLMYRPTLDLDGNLILKDGQLKF